jgi:mannose-6-phosphate isomerase-like protein (cupin superfamily)
MDEKPDVQEPESSTRLAQLVVEVDLLQRCRNASHSGPQWAHESDDLDVTLLSWEAGKQIASHVNNEVDVVWIVLTGSGVAIVDGARHELRPGGLLLFPKGCERRLDVSERLSYLSVHRRRKGLMPTIGGKEIS